MNKGVCKDFEFFSIALLSPLKYMATALSVPTRVYDYYFVNLQNMMRVAWDLEPQNIYV